MNFKRTSCPCSPFLRSFATSEESKLEMIAPHFVPLELTQSNEDCMQTAGAVGHQSGAGAIQDELRGRGYRENDDN